MEWLIEAAFLGESGPYCRQLHQESASLAWLRPGSSDIIPPPTADVQEPGCAEPTAALAPGTRSPARRAKKHKAEWGWTGLDRTGQDRTKQDETGQGRGERTEQDPGG